MTNYVNSMETGVADETTATSAGTSAGSAGTAWTVSTSGGTMKYDTAQWHRGSLSVRMDCIDTQYSRAEASITPSNSAAVMPYLRCAAYPGTVSTDELTIMQINPASGSPAAFLNLKHDGHLRLYNNVTASRWTSTGVVPLNAWWRPHLGVVVGGTTATGTIRAALFAGAQLESATPSEEFTPTTPNTENTGTAQVVKVRAGKVGSGLAWSAWLDDLQWSDSSELYLPAVTGSIPTVVFTVVDAKIIDQSGSTGSPTPTATMTQISGPTTGVVITGPDGAGKFTVALTAGLASSIVVRLTETNTAGAPFQDITITPPSAPATNTVTDFCTWNGSTLVR
jgi:hypothetical protein